MPAILSSDRDHRLPPGLGTLGQGVGPRIHMQAERGAGPAQGFISQNKGHGLIASMKLSPVAALAGSINGSVTQAVLNVWAKYGKNYPWYPYDKIYQNNGYVTLTLADVNHFFQYVPIPQARAWYGGIRTGNFPAQAIFQILQGLQSKYGNATFQSAGKTYPVYGDPYPSPGALVGSLVQGDLQLTKATAAKIQTDLYAHGVIPQSLWMYWLKPLVEMGVIIGTAAVAEGGISAAGSSSALAPTNINLSNAALNTGLNIQKLTPVLETTGSIGTSISPLSTALNSASGGGGLIGSMKSAQGIVSTAGQVVGTVSTLAPLVSGSSGGTFVGAGGMGVSGAAQNQARVATSGKSGISWFPIVLLAAAAGGAVLLL